MKKFSFCFQIFFAFIGTPVLALTGTADGMTQKTICEQLLMKNPHIINISPNRKNLRFSVQKCSKSDMHKQLDWLVEMVKNTIDNSTEKIPKTIIFCNSLKDIATVLNYLLLKLGLYAYGTSKKNAAENLIIGIFHSMSWQHCKERIQQSMKEDGIQRIIVASSALSMGVDFPNVRYVINWGPARSLIEQHQEAGRAGRDGVQFHIVICYHGNQLSKCDDDVKNFVKTEGCLRVAAYKPFDKTITPLSVLHNCCSNCARSCSCQQNSCNEKLPFEDEIIRSQDHQIPMIRVVSQEDRNYVKNAFLEVFKDLSSGSDSFGVCHGFSGELVNSIVENCHKLFTLDDINSYLPIFSLSHSLKILEILNGIFGDISAIDTILEIMQVDQLFQVEDEIPCMSEQYNYFSEESDSSNSLDTDEC